MGEGIQYQENDMTQLMSSETETITPLVKPIFVSGLRKSGTSMMRHLFDGHPDIFSNPKGEFHFFRYTDIDAIGSYRKQLGTTMEERIDKMCGGSVVQYRGSTGQYRL